MHRLIMGFPEGKYVDHINGNSLDNRKSNLRVCTNSENQRNRYKTIRNTSGYKGVRLNTKRNKYDAEIGHHGKHYYLGTFLNPVDAAKAYDEMARKLHGEFAVLNFPVTA